MVKKSKTAAVEEEKENENQPQQQQLEQQARGYSNNNKRKRAKQGPQKQSATGTVGPPKAIINHGPMSKILECVQFGETLHRQYSKELRHLYEKMDHDAFVATFIHLIKYPMRADEGNECARNILHFCALFIASFDEEDTHPFILDIFDWLLSTQSYSPHIRFRLCEFVNTILSALGPEAALDDTICDRIVSCMLMRLQDVSPGVRVEAIEAMQRLQLPDNPDDPIIRAYQYHLCSDPSPRVRQAVITCMGRNYHTIPYVIERLWDIDEKVRRHTYMHMSSYPVRSYKVVQRLTFLEQGLNDRSESVRKVVTTVMLQQWIESYDKNYIELLTALKLDSNEAELERFRKIAKQMLHTIFGRQKNKATFLEHVPIETESEFYRCVPFAKLSIEVALYWQCLTEHLQAEMADEYEKLLPELSVFCEYIEKYCSCQKSELDKFEQMEFQFVLLCLMEILHKFDLGEETGRRRMKALLGQVLRLYTLDEKVIQLIVKCAENIITQQEERLQFFLDIIENLCQLKGPQNPLVHDRALINQLLEESNDTDLNLKLSSLKVKILDIEEKESNLLDEKNYTRAQQKTEEKNKAMAEYMELLRPLLEKTTNPNALALMASVTPDTVLKGLQLTFHMVVSPKVKSLTPNVCKLYNEFICRHLASNHIFIRNWALKCGSAYSMLYEPLAQDVFVELHSQFFRNNNIRLWETAAICIFELLDRYGVDNFGVHETQGKSKRQLYNTIHLIDTEPDESQSGGRQGADVIYMMTHLLDSCVEVCIIRAIVCGFCRLILKGHVNNREIMEKLMLRYFNPSTDPSVSQTIGLFFECLLETPRRILLLEALVPTVSAILAATYDSSLNDIRPETVLRFVVDSTRGLTLSGGNGSDHLRLGYLMLKEMVDNVTKKELCKLLVKELPALEIGQGNEKQREEMKEMTEKLIKSEFDPKTIKMIITFKGVLEGKTNAPVRRTTENDSDEEDESCSVTTVDSGFVSQPAYKEQREKQGTEPITEEEELVSTTASVESLSNVATVAANPPSKENKENNNDKTIITPPEKEQDRAENTQSPSASVPTTYGAENRIGQNCLRRSLNITQIQSDSEATLTAQSPLPRGSRTPQRAKIRIEARIDSDKKCPENGKSSTTKARTPSPKNNVRELPRPRRNLRTGGRNKDMESEQREATTSAASSDTSELGETIEETVKSKSKTGKNEAKTVPEKQNSTKMGSVKRMVTRLAAGRKGPTSRTPNKSLNELNSSDVIAESPTSSLDSTVRRRLATTATFTRSKMREQPSPSKATLTLPANRNSDATPVRNGRKRILQPSPPKIITPSSAANPMRSSLRSSSSSAESRAAKQARTNEQKPKSPSINIHGTRRTTPVATAQEKSNNTTPSRRKIAAGGEAEAASTGSSPSSTKENEATNACKKPTQKQQEATTSLSLPSSDKEATPSLTRTPVLSTGKRNATSEGSKVRQTKDKRGTSNAVASTITTRDAARRELEYSSIMTRKRKRQSLESSGRSRSSSLSTVSSTNYQPKSKMASKIPVRVAQGTDIRTSSSDEGNTSKSYKASTSTDRSTHAVRPTEAKATRSKTAIPRAVATRASGLPIRVPTVRLSRRECQI